MHCRRSIIFVLAASIGTMFSAQSPAAILIDSWSTPVATDYDNAGGSISGLGQTFSLTNPGTFAGATVYIGNAIPPTDGLSGPASLGLYRVGTGGALTLLGQSQVVNTGKGISGQQSLFLSSPVALQANSQYFFAVQSNLDSFGIGLRSLSNSTYSRGSEGFLIGNSVVTQASGRDLAFRVLSSSPTTLSQAANPFVSPITSTWSGYHLNPGNDTSYGALELYRSPASGVGPSSFVPVGNLMVTPPGAQVPGFNFSPDERTFVIAHGWCKGCSATDQPVPGWVTEMAQAIKKSDPNANVLAYNWQKEAATTVVVPASKVPGAASDLAAELTNLAKVTGGLGQLNLLGHSLGAAIVARVGGDAALKFAPDNTVLNRITLFDAPEKLSAEARGGRVVLDEFVANAKARFGVVDNYIGDAALAWGVSYDGIANTVLRNAVHAYDTPPYSPQGWYLKTIDPTLVSTGSKDRSEAATVGFNDSNSELRARYGVAWENSSDAPADGMFHLGPPTVPIAFGSGSNYLSPIASVPIGGSAPPSSTLSPGLLACTSWHAIGTATCADGIGLTLVSHSPAWAFTSFLVPAGIDAFSIFFRPIVWGDGDAFVVGINDQLIYEISWEHFIEGVLSTGILDLSQWIGQEITLSFGLLSNNPDHSLVIERIDFFGGADVSVPLPSVGWLLTAACLGLLASSRRRSQRSWN